MMIKRKFKAIPLVILILVSSVLAGCSRSPESKVAKTGNENQSPTALNNNNVSVNPPKTPAPIGNNISASNGSNASAPMGSNTSTQAVNKKPQASVKEPAPQIGTGGSDMFLFTQVRGALSSDKELADAVVVEIKEGNVTLTGNVSSEVQKAKAGQLVQSVQGVKNVKNNLRVS